MDGNDFVGNVACNIENKWTETFIFIFYICKTKHIHAGSLISFFCWLSLRLTSSVSVKQSSFYVNH